MSKRTDKSILPSELQERKAPNTRLPLKELASEAVSAS